MASSLTLSHEFVPFITSDTSDLHGTHLCAQGIEILERENVANERLAFLSILDTEHNDSNKFKGERGIYINTQTLRNNDIDATICICILRKVNLLEEPQWGSILFLLSSHVFYVHPGPITSASFQSMNFLSNFLSYRIIERPTSEDNSTLLLKEFIPRFTWVAMDLKIKDMEGCETASNYFETKLSNPQHHAMDMEAQMLMNAFLTPTKRDCLMIKSATLETPSSFTSPQVFTSLKVLNHALSSIEIKPFFGRYLNGSLQALFSRSLAHVVANNSELVLERVIKSITMHYWSTILTKAYEKYKNTMHARLSPYERLEINATYLVDVTEKKLQTQNMGMINAGNRKFSSFDQFGNLIRQASMDSMDGNITDSHSELKPLNTGLFTFLKDKAERAFTKKFSMLKTGGTKQDRALTGDNYLHSTPRIEEENDPTESREFDPDANWQAPEPITTEVTPKDLLDKYNAQLLNHTLPMEYVNTQSEAMPVETKALDKIHRQALAEARILLSEFLFHLKCTVSSGTSYSELQCRLNFNIGKSNLLARVRKIKSQFELANSVASGVFCADLIQYLHSVVLRKSDQDHKEKLEIGRSSRRLAVDAPLTKVPIQLLVYKNNLDALVSQYNFIARGPLASKILLGFFQTPIRQRLQALTDKEFSRFHAVCNEKKAKVEAFNEALEQIQEDLDHFQRSSTDFSQQESSALKHVDERTQKQMQKLQHAIAQTDQKIQLAVREQEALTQATIQASHETKNTINKVKEGKNRVYSGYLEKYEKTRVFSKVWKQYYYVLERDELRWYPSKHAWEERSPPCEPPIRISGFKIVPSRTEEMKIKVLQPGRTEPLFRFRAPASVGREIWMKKLSEAANWRP